MTGVKRRTEKIHGLEGFNFKSGFDEEPARRESPLWDREKAQTAEREGARGETAGAEGTPRCCYPPGRVEAEGGECVRERV